MERTKLTGPVPAEHDVTVPATECSSGVERGERRHNGRLETWQRVILRGEHPVSGALINLSASGAQIEILDHESPVVGSKYTMEFVDGTEMEVTVVWRRHERVGVSFSLRFADIKDLLHFDHLGGEYFLRVLAQQKASSGRSDT